MLELENKFAHALHLVGQELFDLLEFNRTLTGVFFNKNLHRPCYVRELKKNLFALVSKIERHVIYRLRNTDESNLSLAHKDMNTLLEQANKLIRIIEKEKKRLYLFKFILSPYLHWLNVLKSKINLYQEIKKEMSNLDTDCHVFFEAINGLESQQSATRSFVLPLWLQFYEMIFPDSIYQDFKGYLKKIAHIEPSSELPELYTVLLKKQLLEKAIASYREDKGEDYPTLFSNIDMTLAALNEIERELKITNNPVINYVERVKERIKVLDIDEALNNTGQFYEMAYQNHEQAQAFSTSSLFSMSASNFMTGSAKKSSKKVKKKNTSFSSMNFSFF